MGRGKSVDLSNFAIEFERNIKKLERILDKKIDDLIAIIMFKIGIKMAYDTGKARGLIRQILSYNLNRSDLALRLITTTYDYWKSSEAREAENPSFDFSKSKNGQYEISIHDYGFQQQEENYDGSNGDRPSKQHPRGEDSNLAPAQVQMTIDIINSGGDDEFNKALTEVEEAFASVIEGW